MTGTKQEDCESPISLGCTWGPGRSSVEGLPSVCKILNLSRRTTYKVITCTGWILLNPWCVRVYTDMMKYELACYMKKHVYDIVWNINIIYMLYIKNACVLWFTKIGEIYWIIFSDIYSLYYSVYTSICMEVVTKSYTDYWFHVYWNYPMDILKPQKILTTVLKCMSLSLTALKFSLKLPSAGLGGNGCPQTPSSVSCQRDWRTAFLTDSYARLLFCVGMHCVPLSLSPWILLKTISFSHPFALISLLPCTQLVPEVLSSISRWLDLPFLLYSVLLTLVSLGMLFTVWAPSSFPVISLGPC